MSGSKGIKSTAKGIHGTPGKRRGPLVLIPKTVPLCRSHLLHLRNLRLKSTSLSTAFGRHASGMVRGRLARRSFGVGGRPRLQTNQIYPCRFVSIRG